MFLFWLLLPQSEIRVIRVRLSRAIRVFSSVCLVKLSLHGLLIHHDESIELSWWINWFIMMIQTTHPAKSGKRTCDLRFRLPLCQLLLFPLFLLSSAKLRQVIPRALLLAGYKLKNFTCVILLRGRSSLCSRIARLESRRITCPIATYYITFHGFRAEDTEQVDSSNTKNSEKW